MGWLRSRCERSRQSELDRRLDFIDFARVHFISALHGSGVGNLFDSIKEAYACATQKMNDVSSHPHFTNGNG